MPVNVQTLSVLRQDLRDVYNNSPREFKFLASVLLPERSVNKRKGSFPVVPRAAHLKHQNTEAARHAEASVSAFGLDEDDFKVTSFRHKSLVLRKDAEDLEGFMGLEEEATLHTRMAIDIDIERRVASGVFSETRFTPSGNTGVTLSNEWDDPTNGTPVTDIADGIVKFVAQNGVMPNALVITFYTWVMGLSRNNQVRGALTDMYGAVKDAIIPLDRLAVVLGVARIIIADGDLVYNTANENAAPSYSNIYSDEYALLTRIAPSGGTMSQGPVLGYTMALDGGRSLEITSWNQNDPAGTWVHSERQIQLKFMDNAPGYLFKNVKS